MDALFAIDSLDQFKSVSHDVLNNLYESDDRFTAVKGAKQEIIQLITDCKFDVDEVAGIIKKKTWDQDKIHYFITTLQERRTDLLYTLLAHNNSTHGESLTTFNWVLKLVLGTSELKYLRYPLVQLTLNTKTFNGKNNQTMYELNKEALGKIISIIEGNIQ